MGHNNSKERLFEVMGKVNPSFKHELNEEYVKPNPVQFKENENSLSEEDKLYAVVSNRNYRNRAQRRAYVKGTTTPKNLPEYVIFENLSYENAKSRQQGIESDEHWNIVSYIVPMSDLTDEKPKDTRISTHPDDYIYDPLAEPDDGVERNY